MMNTRTCEMMHKMRNRTLMAVIGMCLSCTVQADDAKIDRAIAQHRMGTLTVRAEPGADVRIAQLRHEFWFGAALSNGPFSKEADPETAARYKRAFLENFNAAVTENALSGTAWKDNRDASTTRPSMRFSIGLQSTRFRCEVIVCSGVCPHAFRTGRKNWTTTGCVPQSKIGR